MRKTVRLNLLLFLFILLASQILFSCSSVKKVKYFQDIPDSGKLKTIVSAEYSDPLIKVDDILAIVIQTVDPTASQSINVANATSGTQSSAGASSMLGIGGTSGTSASPTGYLVDKEGVVDIPVLGKVKVVGLTTFQLKVLLTELAGKFYKDPIVIVRFSNFKITVTGEVARPGQYVVPNERVTLMDGIAMAGDLTIFGKRENVLLIRENPDGSKTPYRINLLKSNIMSSPYYYLRQNDIIYVEPGKGRAAATDASQTKYITIVASALSVLIVLLSRR